LAELETAPPFFWGAHLPPPPSFFILKQVQDDDVPPPFALTLSLSKGVAPGFDKLSLSAVVRPLRSFSDLCVSART
jgi:hypothetical protein